MNKDQILQLRKSNQLHNEAENRLKELLDKVSPRSYTLKEGYGTTSGRTDTTTFTGKGRIIHTEIIASKGMVLNDINNLHQSSADLRIAILLDEVYDPDVAKMYFTSNAKDSFPRLWISEILDPNLEQKTLGRLEQLLHDLERKVQDSEERVLSVFSNYIDALKLPKGFQQHMGIYPRKKIIIPDFNDEDELHLRFDGLNFSSACNPHDLSLVGTRFDFIDRGHLFRGRTPYQEDSSLFTQCAVGETGEIMFTYFDSDPSNRLTEIYASGIRKVYEKILLFSSKFYESQTYEGLIDVISRIEGVEGKLWIPIDQDSDLVARMIRGRSFYSDRIDIPRFTFSEKEIAQEEKLRDYFGQMFNLLKRNTREIDWR